MSSPKATIKVSKDSLPVSCPPKGTESMGLHPRVYIKLGDDGSSKCPYCGNEFELIKD